MVRINSRTSFGTAGRPGFPRRIFQVQNRRKPLRCQPMTVEAFMMKTPDLPILPDGTEPGPQESIRGRQLRALHGALKNADLMAQRENLQLKRRTAPKRGEQVVAFGYGQYGAKMVQTVCRILYAPPFGPAPCSLPW